MLTKVIPLRKGLKIGDTVHKEIEIRESDLNDLMVAEEEASPVNPIAFRAAIVAQTLIRIGSYKGPFTIGMLKPLKSIDWNKIAEGLRELENLGEDEPASSATS